jgi:hypothetical protein
VGPRSRRDPHEGDVDHGKDERYNLKPTVVLVVIASFIRERFWLALRQNTKGDPVKNIPIVHPRAIDRVRRQDAMTHTVRA